MAFFDAEQLAALKIGRMAFHLVGPEESSLVLLEAFDPGPFADFFLERIRSVNLGAPYSFLPASSTHEALETIDADPDRFQEQSEQLAREFQSRHRGWASSGAFFLFLLEAGGSRAYALLKYDDERVLSYGTAEGGSGRRRAILEALERTFVQNPQALQKSALVRLDEDFGELSVMDRRNQQRVAQYFEDFLGAERVYGDAELTRKLVEVTREVIRENPDLVPPNVYRELTRRTSDAAAAGGSLDHDEQKSFLDVVVGRTLAAEDPLVQKFHAGLRKARIDGVPVTLDPSEVPPPARVRYQTEKGIEIRVPQEMQKLVKVEGERIVIEDKVKQQYDEPARRR